MNAEIQIGTHDPTWKRVGRKWNKDISIGYVSITDCLVFACMKCMDIDMEWKWTSASARSG